MEHRVQAGAGSGSGSKIGTELLDWVQWQAVKMTEGPEYVSCEERLRELKPFSVEKKRLSGMLAMCTNI